MKPTCKLCDEGIPVQKYFDGRMMHFDALMAWTVCGFEPVPPEVAEKGRRIAELERVLALPGNPTYSSQRLPASILGRYRAGETIGALSDDYAIPTEQVEWGIRIAHLLEKIAALESRIAAALALTHNWEECARKCESEPSGQSDIEVHRILAAQIRAALGEPVRKP